MTRYFDGVTQPSFREPSRSYFIHFGRNEKDPEHDIRSGVIKLSGKMFIIRSMHSNKITLHIASTLRDFLNLP
jgi:hypothetical protein